jgi:transposase InsO family protein
MKEIDDTWQIDLIEMQKFARQNKGFRYLLTIIDTFSKFAWAVPVKQKTGKEVTAAFKSVLVESGRKPKSGQSDSGKEFYNTTFQSLMNLMNIKNYSTYSIMKASICKRFNRTLKTMMYKEFLIQGNH